MVKKLQDFCLSCIAKNIGGYHRLGNFLSPRLKEVLLERMCWHKLLLPSNTSSILYHLISHQLQRVNLSYSDQVNDSILGLLGDSGSLLSYLTIQSCPNVSDKGVASLGRVLRKAKGLKLKKISRHFRGKGLECVKSRTLSELNLKGNHNIEDVWLITLINNCPNISKLYLCELFKLTDKAIVHVAKVLGNKLVELDVGELNLITSASTQALADNCQQLNEVKMESCVKLDGSGLVQMAEKCEISSLCFSFCYKVTAQSCDIIVSLLRARGLLRRIDVIGLTVSPVALEMLYSTTSLCSVALCGVAAINDEAVEKITESMGHSLVEFDISTCESLTDQSCGSISKHCTTLEVLGLCNLKNITGSELADFFKDEKRAKQFRSISFSGSKKVTGDIIELIVNSCPNLEVLTIAGIRGIMDVIPESLARNCRKLKKASFKNCDLTDEGVCQLAVHCSEIVMLALSGIHDLTDRSVIALAENCPELRELYVSGCDKITKQAVAYLQDCAVGSVHVSHSTPSAPEGLLMAKDLDAGEYRRMDLLDYDSLRTLDTSLAF